MAEDARPNEGPASRPGEGYDENRPRRHCRGDGRRRARGRVSGACPGPGGGGIGPAGADPLRPRLHDRPDGPVSGRPGPPRPLGPAAVQGGALHREHRGDQARRRPVDQRQQGPDHLQGLCGRPRLQPDGLLRHDGRARPADPDRGAAEADQRPHHRDRACDQPRRAQPGGPGQPAGPAARPGHRRAGGRAHAARSDDQRCRRLFRGD